MIYILYKFVDSFKCKSSLLKRIHVTTYFGTIKFIAISMSCGCGLCLCASTSRVWR